MEVTPGDGVSTVAITVPQSWLSDPARKYPVLIDPTFETEWGTNGRDTWVGTAAKSTSHGSEIYMNARDCSDPAYQKARSLVQFDLPEGVYTGYVTYAKLRLTVVWTSGTQYPIQIAAMSKKWTESSTWNSLEDYRLNYATSANNTGTGSTIQADVTNIARHWADSSEPNYGFCVYSDKLEGSHKFYTRETGARFPALRIDYVPRVNVYWNGAYGNDELDDTEEIQAAIEYARESGGKVYIPGGYYFVSGLDLNVSDMILCGDGSSSMLIFREDPNDKRTSLLTVGGTSAVENVTIENLSLSLPKGVHGITLDGTGGGSDIEIRNVVMQGGGDSSDTFGVQMASEAYSDVKITDCYLSPLSCLPLGSAERPEGQEDLPEYLTTLESLSVSGNQMPYQPYRADQFRGEDAVDTALRLAKAGWPGTAPGVVLVPDASYVDALIAGPLAAAYSGPVLCAAVRGPRPEGPPGAAAA